MNRQNKKKTPDLVDKEKKMSIALAGKIKTAFSYVEFILDGETHSFILERISLWRNDEGCLHFNIGDVIVKVGLVSENCTKTH